MAGFQKMDTALQKEIDKISAQSDGEEIQFLAKLSEEPSTQLREAIGRMGITIETAAGKIVTASGTPNAIRDLAAMDVVETLQLSQTRDMLNR